MDTGINSSVVKGEGADVKKQKEEERGAKHARVAGGSSFQGREEKNDIEKTVFGKFREAHSCNDV